VQVKLLHEKLKWCYYKEGVNHLENCKELVDAMCAKIRAKGALAGRGIPFNEMYVQEKADKAGSE
jgi:hypothetical protein